ncbi:Ger(x)C family spore germination protein [Oceanobacillus salinisoli]|uniref:Ger(x)C family spore germination protein n=1 Tax=Oceanobacillus salinisoli TaxID=2678611 RepID=UPI0012E2CEF8|nr:Ger(x)C family spore germination protein [Oceanobacillus salinisoli]
MKNKSLAIIIVCILVLTSCIPTNNIEELAIITARGVDRIEDNRVETVLNVARFDPQTQNIFATVSGTGNTVKGAREDAGNRLNYELKEGQIDVELYGNEAAKQGIFPYIGGLIRDARVSDTMKLVISNTTAKEILEFELEQGIAIGEYLADLIEIEVDEGALPSSTLQDFTRRGATIGQDAALTLIDIKEDKPSIVGMAVLQDDRYVLEISTHEGFLLNLFLNQIRNTPIELTLPLEPFQEYIEKIGTTERERDERETFSIQLTGEHGNSKTKVKNLEELKFQTDIYLDLEIAEISQPISIKDKKASDLLEKEMEKKIQQQFEELLKKTQEVNADPFGFGKIYRANKEDGRITPEEWREKYPNINVEFNVNVKLMHTGTVQ